MIRKLLPQSRPRSRHLRCRFNLLSAHELNPTISGPRQNPWSFSTFGSPEPRPNKGDTLAPLESEFLAVAGSSASGTRKQIQGLESFARHRRCLLARRIFDAGRGTRQFPREISSLVRHQRRATTTSPPLLDFPRTGRSSMPDESRRPQIASWGSRWARSHMSITRQNGPKATSSFGFFSAWRWAELHHQA